MHRSLVTTLRAAAKFDSSHLETIQDIVDKVLMYYVGGFFLSHGIESALLLAKKAAESSKVRSLPSIRTHPRYELKVPIPADICTQPLCPLHPPLL
jgi:hypothetical protein